MLNKEKYAKEILEIACTGDNLGMKNGKLCACEELQGCDDCDFSDFNNG